MTDDTVSSARQEKLNGGDMHIPFGETVMKIYRIRAAILGISPTELCRNILVADAEKWAAETRLAAKMLDE